MQVIISIMMLPVEEGNILFTEVIEDVKNRPAAVKKKVGRMLSWGLLIDHTAFTDLIESSGLNIVMDDTVTCVRPFWHDIEETDDPLLGKPVIIIEQDYSSQALESLRTIFQAIAERIA